MSEQYSSFFPRVLSRGDVTSSLDVAFELAHEGHLDVWDSLIVKSQSAGRGQLRRIWNSPPGNLYTALRLPLLPPFDSSAASVAVGAFLADALCQLGWPTQLKWPNDLVLKHAGAPHKIGGILLEERKEILLAGIGINVISAPEPEFLRKDAAMFATSLAEFGPSPPLVKRLWRQLVKLVYSMYTVNSAFSEHWKDKAERLLLWRDSRVMLVDTQETLYGRLAGVAFSGGIRLYVDGIIRESLYGELRLV